MSNLHPSSQLSLSNKALPDNLHPRHSVRKHPTENISTPISKFTQELFFLKYDSRVSLFGSDFWWGNGDGNFILGFVYCTFYGKRLNNCLGRVDSLGGRIGNILIFGDFFKFG